MFSTYLLFNKKKTLYEEFLELKMRHEGLVMDLDKTTTSHTELKDDHTNVRLELSKRT